MERGKAVRLDAVRFNAAGCLREIYYTVVRGDKRRDKQIAAVVLGVLGVRYSTWVPQWDILGGAIESSRRVPDQSYLSQCIFVLPRVVGVVAA